MDYKDIVLKIGKNKYRDWFNRPATKEQYDAYQSSLLGEKPALVSEKKPELPIADTDIPHKEKLIDAGITTVDELPNKREDLIAIKGIGEVSADDIAVFAEHTWGHVIK